MERGKKRKAEWVEESQEKEEKFWEHDGEMGQKARGR